MEKSSSFYDPAHSRLLPPAAEKQLQAKIASMHPKPADDTLMLAGFTIPIKESMIYVIHEEKPEEGATRFKVIPYVGQRMDGKALPLIVLYAGHVYYPKEHGQALQEALDAEEDLDHPILQIYQQRDPNVTSETCWHEIDDSALNAIKQKLSMSSLFEEERTRTEQHTREHRETSSKSDKGHKHKKPPMRRPRVHQPHPVEPKQEPTTLAGVEQRIVDRNPGSLDNIVEETSEWVKDKRLASKTAESEATRKELRKADLGHLDDLRPLYQGNLRSMNKEERRRDDEPPPPTPPDHRISHFSV